MLVLFETPAGFAIFKVLDEGKLSKVDDLWKEFSTAESARKVVELKAFSKFENISEALSSFTLLIDGEPNNDLLKFLRSQCEGESLAVADSKLGNAIKEKLKIECVHNNAVIELIRGMRAHLTELISGMGVQDLAHRFSRFEQKIIPDKVDTMIIHAIFLLDDLDKELNTSAMRVREWYGWHFPELAIIVQDNNQYAKAVKMMGNRVNAANLDFSEVLSEKADAELKVAAGISIGIEVDMLKIRELCDQVIVRSEYGAKLYDYLRSMMNTIAPNLTALVGELVGARLIAHCGSLWNLANQPGSTIQILGAEKAFFRALRTKHATQKNRHKLIFLKTKRAAQKYGIIFHAPLVVQAASKIKWKISRAIAAKAALASRCDALGHIQDSSIGLEHVAKIEARLRFLEASELKKIVVPEAEEEHIKKEKRENADGEAEAQEVGKEAAVATDGNEEEKK